MATVDYTFKIVDVDVSTSKATVVYTSTNNFHSPVVLGVFITDPTDLSAVELEITRLAPLDFWIKQEEQPFPLPDDKPVSAPVVTPFISLVGMTSTKTDVVAAPSVLGSYERAILQVTRDSNSTIAIAEKI